MTAEEAQRLVAAVPHWHHSFEIAPGVTTPGSYAPSFLLEKLRWPADLSGRSVLDIGPSDGFFSLEAWRRGAKVTSVDYRAKDSHGFGAMEKITGFEFDYHQLNVYDIPGANLGKFDIVIFLGVLYHLPDMIKALAICRAACLGTLFIETHCSADLDPEIALARYFRADTLAGDVTNFWSPNPRCVRDMLEDAGFDVIREETWDDRYFGEAIVVDAGSGRARKLALGYGLL